MENSSSIFIVLVVWEEFRVVGIVQKSGEKNGVTLGTRQVVRRRQDGFTRMGVNSQSMINVVRLTHLGGF